jgi:hypothetical protein
MIASASTLVPSGTILVRRRIIEGQLRRGTGVLTVVDDRACFNTTGTSKKLKRAELTFEVVSCPSLVDNWNHVCWSELWLHHHPKPECLEFFLCFCDTYFKTSIHGGGISYLPQVSSIRHTNTNKPLAPFLEKHSTTIF